MKNTNHTLFKGSTISLLLIFFATLTSNVFANSNKDLPKGTETFEVQAKQTNKADLLQGLEVIVAGKGKHLVVFESGFGVDAQVWSSIANELNQSFKTVRYSRNGLGKSQNTVAVPTIQSDIATLQQVIRKAKESINEDGKVILVAHSYGGLLATELAQQSPDLLAGLVLVDPTVKQQRNVFVAANAERIAQDDAMLNKYLPPAMKAQYSKLIADMQSSGTLVKALPKSLSTVLISSSKQYAQPFVFEETQHGKRLWLELQLQLLEGVSNAQHVSTAEAGHNIHVEQPDLVIKAVNSIDL